MENFMKILLVGSELFHAEERTVRQKGRLICQDLKSLFPVSRTCIKLNFNVLEETLKLINSVQIKKVSN